MTSTNMRHHLSGTAEQGSGGCRHGQIRGKFKFKLTQVQEAERFRVDRISRKDK